MRLILTRATRKSASAVCLLSFHTSEEPKNKFDGAHRNPRAPVLFPFFSFFVKVHEVLVGESFPVILSRCFLSICQMSTVRPLRNPIIIIHGFGLFFFFSFLITATTALDADRGKCGGNLSNKLLPLHSAM